MMEADQIRKLLEAADATTKAMLLLGVNCGFGPTDCATLPVDAVDLDAGFISYARPKTGIARRCPLWPETVQALKDATLQPGRLPRIKRTPTSFSSQPVVIASSAVTLLILVTVIIVNS